MDIDNRRLTAFMIGFSAVMLGVILYHVLLSEEMNELRYYRLYRQITEDMAALAEKIGGQGELTSDPQPA